jgi:phytoene synthase
MSRQAGGSSGQGLADFVRRHDPDRFLTALFAPPPRRETLFVLYAFNHELARAIEVASQPMLALIRLQWWREVVEGTRKRHEVADPLSDALAAGALDAADLLALIEARETEIAAMGSETAEAEPIATVADWQAWLRAGAGGVSVAAARALEAPDAEALRPYGVAYGAAGVLRTVKLLARRGRCLLPADALAAHGLTPADVIAAPDAAALREVLAELAAVTLTALPAPARLPPAVIAAALPAVLARRDLRRVQGDIQPRGLADRLAVIWAGLRRRV